VEGVEGEGGGCLRGGRGIESWSGWGRGQVALGFGFKYIRDCMGSLRVWMAFGGFVTSVAFGIHVFVHCISVCINGVGRYSTIPFMREYIHDLTRVLGYLVYEHNRTGTLPLRIPSLYITRNQST